MTPLTARLTSASVNLAFDMIATQYLKFVTFALQSFFPATTEVLPANHRLEIQGPRVACPPRDARENANRRPERRGQVRRPNF